MRHRAEPSDADVDASGGVDGGVDGGVGVGADPAPRRRLRLGVGAVVVLLLVAFGVAVLTPLFALRGGEVPVPVGSGRGASASASGPASASAAVSSYGPEAGELFVHVSGAVVTPGLVTLSAGARVVDAVAAAGGFTPEADPAGVNLARPLGDGEQLVVPRVGEVPPPASSVGGGGAATGSSTGMVNLNTAPAADLETLPRIGPALAQRIIDWREANGRFSSPDDLRKVAGIGDKIFDGLKDRVTV